MLIQNATTDRDLIVVLMIVNTNAQAQKFLEQRLSEWMVANYGVAVFEVITHDLRCGA